MRNLIFIALAVLVCAGCPSPEGKKKIEEKLRVPGLQEGITAVDRAVKTDIIIAWSSDPGLTQVKQYLHVDLRGSSVIISGRVPNEKLRERAEEIARSTPRVKELVNEIVVDPELAKDFMDFDE